MSMTEAQLLFTGSAALVVLVVLATRYRGKGLGGALRTYFLLIAALLPPILALYFVSWFEEQEGLEFFALQGGFKIPFNVAIVVVGAAAIAIGLRVWRILGRKVS